MSNQFVPHHQNETRRRSDDHRALSPCFHQELGLYYHDENLDDDAGI